MTSQPHDLTQTFAQDPDQLVQALTDLAAYYQAGEPIETIRAHYRNAIEPGMRGMLAECMGVS